MRLKFLSLKFYSITKDFFNSFFLIKRNQTAKNIIFLFFFTTGINIINFIYHIVMGRILGPSEYGVLALVISIFIISNSVASTIQTASAKYSSIYYIENNLFKIRSLFLELTKGVLIVTFLIFAIILIFIRKLQVFLNLDSINQIILLGLIIILGSQLMIGRGILQGTKKFIFLGINQLLENLLRLIFGLILVYLGIRSTGATTGILFGLLITFLLLLLQIKNIITRNKNDIKKISIYKENRISIKTFYKSILFILMTNIIFSIISYSDISLVKHFFTATEAGYYSAVNQIGKIILFFPLSVGLVILPRLSEKIAKKIKLLAAILKGLLLVTLLSFIFLIFYYFFPKTIVKIMFGNNYLPSAKFVFQYGLFMAFIALINLELYYFIVTDRFIYLIILVFFLIEQLAMIFLFHSSLNIIIIILLLNAAALFFISFLLILYFEKKQKV